MCSQILSIWWRRKKLKMMPGVSGLLHSDKSKESVFDFEAMWIWWVQFMIPSFLTSFFFFFYTFSFFFTLYLCYFILNRDGMMRGEKENMYTKKGKAVSKSNKQSFPFWSHHMEGVFQKQCFLIPNIKNKKKLRESENFILLYFGKFVMRFILSFHLCSFLIISMFSWFLIHISS